MIKPFISVILSAIIFSYIFAPLNDFIIKKLKSKNLASAITLVLIILIAIIPTVMIGNTIVKESYANYLTAKQKISAGFGSCETGKICELKEKFERDILGQDIEVYLKTNLEKFTSKIISNITGFIMGTASKVLHMFIFLFLTFFLLRDGKSLSKKILPLILLNAEHKKKIVKEISELVYAVVFGTIIVAFIQGIVGSIGFIIFGVSSPVVWGLIVAFAALIPFIGTSIIWLPMSLYMIGNGLLTSETLLIGKGIGLMIYGFLIIGTIDNVLKPKIIGDRSILHPALVMLGVTGGVMLFGFIGVLVGPIILALLVILIKMYETSFHHYRLSDFKLKKKSK
jgi:predicted PurR-regulated permease PerM